MRKLLYVMALSLLMTAASAPLCISAYAAEMQQSRRSVSGTVTDKVGQPVIGASIIVTGTGQGAITDLDGKFVLDVNEGAKALEVSCIGYVDQTITLGPGVVYNIVLEDNKELLDEVVVVGYGIQKKVNLTGAVSSVNFEELSASRPIVSTASALAGTVAGLSIRTTSSEPGAESNTIRVRGTGTLNTAVPLYIVDGIESNISYVNPQDIASITVLKDAASCAIYGNRGANGVILITTKKAQDGKVTVNYNGSVSFDSPMHNMAFMTNYADYMEILNESLTNIGQAENFLQTTIDTWRAAEKNPNAIADSGYPNYVAYPNIDWQDWMYRNVASTEHNISISGSEAKSSYLVSGNFLNNPGLMENTGAKKYSLRANIEARPVKWLAVGLQAYGYVQNKEPGGYSTPVSYMAMSTPGQYPYYDGYYGFPAATEESATANNPYYNIMAGQGTKRDTRFKTAAYANITFLKDFNFKVLGNYGRYWYDYQTETELPQLVRMNFSTGLVSAVATKPEDLSTSFTANGNWDTTLQAILNWAHTYGDHDLSAMAGYEEFYYYSYSQSASKKGLIDASIWTASTATEMTGISGSATDYSSRSYFGRANYAFKNKYLFEANLRYDGSSRFAADSRWGLFPSFSAGWRIDQEPWMKSSNVDNLKIRASWGKLGNNSIGNYDYQSTYSAANYIWNGTLTNGLAVTALANNALRWETTTSADIGVDVGILNNRLTAELDLYNKVTDGILYRPTIYLTAGTATAPYQNIAAVTNKGVEISLGWKDQAGDFFYSFNGNFAYNHNAVSKYKGKLEQYWQDNADGTRTWVSNLGVVSTGGSTRVLEGHTISEYYMLQTYSGNGNYFNSDGSVNVNGGPKDGMIRSENDMTWLRAMVDAGYQFYPQQGIGKGKIWYGDYIYADLDGDGIYGNTYDNAFTGLSSTPKYTFGFQASAAWKGIDVSMSWAGAAGFNLYWRTTGLNSTGTRTGYNLLQAVADDHYFYDPENPGDPRTNTTSKNSRLTCNEGNNQQGATSTLWLYKGDYFKLKNLTVGYSFPANLTQRIGVAGARVYFSGENLFNITKYPGQDPEMGAGMGYVTMRQLSLGLNLTF